MISALLLFLIGLSATMAGPEATQFDIRTGGPRVRSLALIPTGFGGEHETSVEDRKRKRSRSRSVRQSPKKFVPKGRESWKLHTDPILESQMTSSKHV